MLPKSATGIGAAAGVVIISLFFPWLLVSCSEQPVLQLSGWQLATGEVLPSPLGSQSLPGHAELFLIPGLAIVILIMACRAYIFPSSWPAAGALGARKSLPSRSRPPWAP